MLRLPKKFDYRLSEKIWRLSWLCFWSTAIPNMTIPQCVKKTPEQLGIGQTEPGVLRLPDGLETVEDNWFGYADIEKVIVSSSVKVLGGSAFCRCEKLR